MRSNQCVNCYYDYNNVWLDISDDGCIDKIIANEIRLSRANTQFLYWSETFVIFSYFGKESV